MQISSSTIDRCGRGDSEAWNTLVRHYSGLVYTVPMRMGLPHDQCDDVLQDTFLLLFENFRGIDDPTALPKWLVVVARRNAMHRRRRASREIPAWVSLERDQQDVESLAIAEIDRETRSHKVVAALNDMPCQWRRLVQMLFYEDRSYAEAASDLGISIGSVGPIRGRCLRRLAHAVTETDL